VTRLGDAVLQEATSAIRTRRSATLSSAGSPRRGCRRGRFSSVHACCS